MTEVKGERADQDEQWVTNFSMHQNHLGSLVNHRWLITTPRVSDSEGLGGTQEFVFLISSWKE